MTPYAASNPPLSHASRTLYSLHYQSAQGTASEPCAAGMVYPYAPAAWRILGQAAFSDGEAWQTALAAAPDGTLYLVYCDDAHHSRISVKHFNGRHWVGVGRAGFSDGMGWFVALAIHPDGTPYVAYCDDSFGGRAVVKRFNGKQWTAVGNPSGLSRRQVWHTQLAFAPDGTLFLAYTGEGPQAQHQTTVLRCRGQSWSYVGETFFSDSSTGDISLAIGPDGTPCLAYRDMADGDRATVMFFDGDIWRKVCGSAASTGGADSLALAISPRGQMIVAFRDWAHEHGMTVCRLDPENYCWTPLGQPNITGVQAEYPSLAFGADDTVHLLFSDWRNEGRATLLAFDGHGWRNIGIPCFSAGQALHTSLLLLPGDTACAAFTDRARDNRCSVMLLRTPLLLRHAANIGPMRHQTPHSAMPVSSTVRLPRLIAGITS